MRHINVQKVTHYEIPLEKTLSFFISSWFQHDGQWFLKTMKRYGMKEGREINEAAIFSLGKIEIGRFGQLTGVENFGDCVDFMKFWTFYFSSCFNQYYGSLENFTEILELHSDVFRVKFSKCIGWEMAQAAQYSDMQVGEIPACGGNKRHWEGWLSSPGNEGRFSLEQQPKLDHHVLACEYIIRRKN